MAENREAILLVVPLALAAERRVVEEEARRAVAEGTAAGTGN
jgi:hypothetical protein